MDDRRSKNPSFDDFKLGPAATIPTSKLEKQFSLSSITSTVEGDVKPKNQADNNARKDSDIVSVLKPSQYTEMQWKNGLGTTTEIAISPSNADFKSDEFLWRFYSSFISDSIYLSLFPGYEVTMIVLPHDGNQPGKYQNYCLAGGYIKGSYSPASLHHNDLEKPIPLKTLTPYSWPGEWPTVCRVSGTGSASKLKVLSFLNNRNKTKVSFQIETIVLHNHDKDSEEMIPSTLETISSNNSSTNTLLMGNITILYVISGTIKVSVDGGKTPYLLKEEESLICERADSNAATDVTLTPILKPIDSKFIHKGGLGLAYHSIDADDATVLIIQVHLLKVLQREPSTFVLPPLSPVGGLLESHQGGLPPKPCPATKSGSIIVFDDQPMWNLPAPTSTQKEIQSESPTGYGAANLQTKYFESAQHYRPPVFSDRYRNESDVPPPVTRDRLVIEEFPVGTISTAWINMVKQGLSEWIRVPVIVARGVEPGPVIGITAVVHGNELNGVPCIHRVITDIDVSQLKGAVVAVPCVNIPGYLRFSREFSDGKDLNRAFPGSETGTASQIYNYNLFNKIIKQFNFLIDLHTASFGRVNSYYVRADMNDPVSSVFAKLQQPQIILHNSGQDGTLRSAASAIGIKAITVEIGNPQLFQKQYVQWSYKGVMRILEYLHMFKSSIADLSSAGSTLTILCSRGFWIYTKTGGVLEVYPSVNSVIRKGDLIARIKNIFGNIVDEIYCSHSGVAIGRSSNPVAMAGDRILHLGIIKKDKEVLASEAKENY